MLGAMKQMNYLGQPQGNYWQVGSTWSGSGNPSNRGLSSDSSDNVYTFNAASTGIQPDAVLLKYNASGVAQWGYRLFDSTDAQTFFYSDIVTDASGNSYCVGELDNGSGGWFIVKYNNAGTVQWQKKWDFGVEQRALGVTISANGNIIVVGTMDYDAYVMAIDSDGTVQWTRYLTAGSSSARGIARKVVTDSANNVYVVSDDATSTDSVILTKWNSTGTWQWSRDMAVSSTSETSYSIDVDSSDNIYVCVWQQTTTPSAIWTILKFNSSGTVQWQRDLTVGNSGAPQDIIVNGSNLLVSGYVTVSSLQYAFIAQYNLSGTIQFQKRLAVTGAYTICYYDESDLASNGDVFMQMSVGGYAGSVTLRLNSTGVPTNSWTWNSATFTYSDTSYTEGTGTITVTTISPTTASRTVTLSNTTFTNTTVTLTNVLATISS